MRWEVLLDGQAQAEPTSPEALLGSPRSRFDCWELIRTGGYPPIHARAIPPEAWQSDHVRTHVERDVRMLAPVGDLAPFERFRKLCVGRLGQLRNASSLASSRGIAVDTARRWLSPLTTSFVVFLLPPHLQSFSKRLIKSPKLYFHDTGRAFLVHEGAESYERDGVGVRPWFAV